MPANALLVYNRKYGQFINGITGQTHDHKTPTGFVRPIPTITKTLWGQWKGMHPSTKVMTPLNLGAPKDPNLPLQPWFAQRPLNDQVHPRLRVTMVATTQPIAVQTDQVKEDPLNLTAGDTPVLLFRDPNTGHARRLQPRHRRPAPHVLPQIRPERKDVYFIDSDTNTLWTSDLRASLRPPGRAKEALAPLGVDENLYWATMKFWLPALELK